MSEVLIAGVDEAGRGPLAGPVYAAAVILDRYRPIDGLRDSKLLSAKQREQLSEAIQNQARAWAIASASVEEIDRLNILQATLLAMTRAVHSLSVTPQQILVDGNRCPSLSMPTLAIIKGDRDIPAISAASILAKTARDAVLLELDRQFPQYGFAQHKGYATEQHLAALRLHGPCAQHRRSFSPVLQREFDFGESMD